MTLASGFLLALVPLQTRDGGYDPNKEPASTALRSLHQSATPRRNSSALSGKGFYGGGLRRHSRSLLPSSRRGTPPTTGATYIATGTAARSAGAAGVMPGANAVPPDFATALRALVPGMVSTAPGAAQAVPGATGPDAASKWDLLGMPTASRVPSALIAPLMAGPLTEAEAAALVEQFTQSRPEPEPGTTPVHPELARLHASSPDPDLQTLQADLEAQFPPADPASPHALDGAALRNWFQAIDVSRDAAISFLEWRDRTSLPLAAFRRVDESGEGLLSFDEFSRAMLLNSARSGGPSVDPALLQWALGIEETAAGQSADSTDVASMSQDELMRRAREELTTASQLLRLDAEVRARTAPAQNGAAAPADPKATVRPPSGKPTPVRVLFQTSRAPRPAPPRSAFQTVRQQRAQSRE